MAQELISEIVKPEAFAQVDKLEARLKDLEKIMLNLASTSIGGGSTGSGGGGSRAAMSEMEKLQKQILDLQNKINVATSEEAKQVAELKNQLSGLSNATKMAATVASGSYAEMENRLKLLRKEIDHVGDAEGANAVKVKNLVSEYNKLDAVVRRHNESMGNFSKSVGNYAKGTQAMSLGIAQIAREMPNFAQSIQIGVMSLTNNIGGIIDGVKALRLQNAALAAEGKSTQSILMGVGKAIFSWNTLLFVGVTVLTLYSGKIMEWIQGTDTAGKRTKELAEAQKALSESIGQETGKLETNIRILNDKNATHKEQLRVAKELKDSYPTHLKNYDLEAIAAGKAASAIMEIKDALIAVAMAHAAQADMDKMAAEKWTNLQNISKLKADLITAQGASRSANEAANLSRGNTSMVGDYTIYAANRAANVVDDLKARINALSTENMRLDLEMNKTASSINKFATQANSAGIGLGGSDVSKGRKKGKKDNEQNRMDEIKKQYDLEQSLLDIAHNEGLVSDEQYYVTREGIAEKYLHKRSGLTKDELASEIEFNKKLTEVAKDSTDKFFELLDKRSAESEKVTKERQKKELEAIKEFFKAENAVELEAIKERLKNAQEEAKKKAEFQKHVSQASEDLTHNIIDGATEMASTVVDVWARKLKEKAELEQKLLDNREKAELDALDRMSMSDEKRAEEKMKIELKFKDQKEKAHREDVKRARRLAILQKNIDLGQVIANTAIAISKHSREPYPLNVILMASDAVIGATQTAAILAAPIPQYKDGIGIGNGEHKGGLAVVGDGGKREVIITPDGKVSITPNKPTLKNLPARTKVLPDADKLMQDVYMMSIGKMASHHGVITTNVQQDALLSSFNELTGEVKQLKHIMASKNMHNEFYGDFAGFIRHQNQIS